MTKESEGKTNKPETARERRESQQHQDNVAIADAINRITEQLVTDEKEQKRSENQGAGRERLTIILLFLTVIFTAGADLIFNQTMLEAKLATIDAHEDSNLAIERAGWAAWDAVYAAHIDSDAALKSSNAASNAALEKAAEANEISNKSLLMGQRAWVAPISANFGTAPVIGNPINVFVGIQNTGRSPALDINIAQYIKAVPLDEQKFGLEVFNIPEFTQCDNIKPLKGSSSIFPSNFINKTGFPISKSHVYPATLAARTHVLVWKGCVAYNTLGSPHTTKFCYWLRPTESADISLWAWDTCLTGNSAD